MPLALRTLLGFSFATALVCACGAADDTPKPEAYRPFKPVARPKVPEVRGVARINVDRFILAALEAKQLGLNPEADRATLIRRVCFDLTGLPPTLAEIDQFLADKSPDAYEKMVDRYLASPHYGERWGKFWLDAAGYADSNGYFNADSDRPLAWKYRDFVVKSFNADKPYDQFVREQLAGDELVGYAPGGDVTPAMVDALTATHFLRNAPDGTGESDGNPDEVRTDRFTVLEGNVQNLMNCLLGLTVQCARCHDHKFEPISQEEYFGLQALLFPVYNPERWTKPNDRLVTVGTQSELAVVQRKMEFIDRQVKAAQTALNVFADPLRDQLLDERLKDLPLATRVSIIDAVKAPKGTRKPAQNELLKTHAKAVEVGDDDLAKRFPEFDALRTQVKQTVAAREKERPKPPEKIAAFVETDPNPTEHHVLKRGLHNQPGVEVAPGALEALSKQNPFAIAPRPAGRVSTGRRTAFAKWVTAPENPLFARVMVNRIWQHHFGTGLVATTDNLGSSGAKPLHPELLDYLAAEFMQPSLRQPNLLPPFPRKEGGTESSAALSPSPLGGGVGEGLQPQPFSVKAIHRLILTSAVYRQTSTPHDKLAAVDPDNHLLARFPLRRLDAEAVRDAMLHVSGELDMHTGGPYVPSKRTPEGTVEIDEKAPGAHKRSIYLQQRRTQVVTFLQLFDAPSIVTTCGKRTPSTVPLQSLALLNAEFARARGKAFAARLVREAGDDSAKRLTLAFRLACGREPNRDEREVCETFLDKQRGVYAQDKDADARAWADLCQMVLASNAFLYTE
ncbi:Uncharacterized protein OS=Planctomyces maris DSM 8797 GN=PM8797T_30072 PE=4 SV=1: PSCyt2: PSD1: PSD1 [Gemmata massiliana]|uniref:Cytochrome c domain-containing protein n=1 Tax=Gemmata massiliana TaxID=1210884 RepID=A0A6P2D492_9BACT|nr:DUF1549 and DUF1553 domain-containing protein [Gemmata massiliana]VTR95306.1 Uncharacterized protein OS=Planctomyces maris DSM 8797 GN=PM8797T_30072 PE=4 SV=1: PSCyt2: PSD1: PSD1 [Gemmata massiliana]